MATWKKLASVTLAIAIAAVVAFVLQPSTGPKTSAVVGQPNPTTNVPSTPDRLSSGPHHAVCLKANDHIPEQARVRGANWYRFYDATACTVSAILDLVRL